MKGPGKLGFVLVGLAIACVPTPGLGQAARRERRPLGECLQALSKRFGVAIEAAREPGSITGAAGRPGGPLLTWTAAGEAEYLDYVAIFEGALAKYPPALLRAAGLRKFVWCTGIVGDRVGRDKSGLFLAGDATIYLDVRIGKQVPGGRRFTVHHEVFHAIDFRVDRSFDDKDWEAISGAGAYDRRASASAPPGDRPTDLGVLERGAGFMTSYSRSEVREDKAELFACMMALPIFVESRMKDEPPMVRKVRRMEALIKQACPGLADDFWASPARDK